MILQPMVKDDNTNTSHKKVLHLYIQKRRAFEAIYVAVIAVLF